MAIAAANHFVGGFMLSSEEVSQLGVFVCATLQKFADGNLDSFDPILLQGLAKTYKDGFMAKAVERIALFLEKERDAKVILEIMSTLPDHVRRCVDFRHFLYLRPKRSSESLNFKSFFDADAVLAAALHVMRLSIAVTALRSVLQETNVPNQKDVIDTIDDVAAAVQDFLGEAKPSFLKGLNRYGTECNLSGKTKDGAFYVNLRVRKILPGMSDEELQEPQAPTEPQKAIVVEVTRKPIDIDTRRTTARRMRREGLTLKEIAEKLGVSVSTISKDLKS